MIDTKLIALQHFEVSAEELSDEATRVLHLYANSGNVTKVESLMVDFIAGKLHFLRGCNYPNLLSHRHSQPNPTSLSHQGSSHIHSSQDYPTERADPPPQIRKPQPRSPDEDLHIHHHNPLLRPLEYRQSPSLGFILPHAIRSTP